MECRPSIVRTVFNRLNSQFPLLDIEGHVVDRESLHTSFAPGPTRTGPEYL